MYIHVHRNELSTYTLYISVPTKHFNCDIQHAKKSEVEATPLDESMMLESLGTDLRNS